MVLIGIEAALTGLVVGVLKESWLWGIGAWIALQGIYFIPYIGSSISMFVSVIEAVCIYEVLTSLKISSTTGILFMSLFSFFILIFVHKQYGEVQDESQVGYGWFIFESVLISLFFHNYTKSIISSFILFSLIIIISFIPKMRVMEYIFLSLFAGYVMYGEFYDIVSGKYAMMGAISISIFSGIMYALVFKKIDYIGYKKAKEERKSYEDEKENINALKNRIYEKYPQLEKEYYYFYTVVCKNEKEQVEFYNDWIEYLNYMDNEGVWINFNEFFDIQKLYKYHFYNRDYARSYQMSIEKNEKENQKQQKFYIDCCYDEKDIVKKLGAKWDYKKKKWYYINPEDKTKFQKWIQKNNSNDEKSKSNISNVDKYECPELEPIEFEKLGFDYENYLIIDTETTGLQSDDEVVELAIIDFKGRELYHSLYQPEKVMHWAAAKKTGITNRLLAESPNFKDEWLKIKEIVSGKKLIAHNINFDYRLIKQTLTRYGLDEKEADDMFSDSIDSIEVAKKYVKSSSYKLENVCSVLGIEEEQKHRATYDCLMILKMFRAIEISR